MKLPVTPVPALAAVRRAVPAWAARAAREPLAQFLAAALVLFSVDGALNGADHATSTDTITVTEGRVRQLAESYRLLSGRPPSRAELEAFVEDYIDEEVAYREAIAMGLDADDTIVRRRMRQKLMFLAEDAEASEEPSEAELAAWLADHAAQYRIPARVSFRQVLASTDVWGAGAPAEAAALLERLRAGADPAGLGDASMLPPAMPLTTREGVATLFGDDFAAAVLEHAGEGWLGPVASPFGAHAVLVTAREPARDTVFDEVRAKLRADWIEARRRAARDALEARLLERYEVSVAWPEPYAGQAGSGRETSVGE